MYFVLVVSLLPYLKLFLLVSGDPITVSNPEGTFDTNRLQSVTQSVLLAAGSGMLMTIIIELIIILIH